MYEEFYHLSGKPFQLTPDHRFFFDSRGHHRALAYLRYGLEQGEGFVVITGGIGTGKTMLLRALFDELDGYNVMAAQLVTTQVEPEDMLRMVCASFGLAHEGFNKATLLHNLEQVARARFAEGRRVLLVVDEAQNLPARSLEELRMLANFQIEGRSLFQNFLLGQESLRKTLQLQSMEQLRQRIIAAYHLDPLSGEETQAYIEFRLNCVGWCGKPALAADVFTLIHAETDGVPRRINTFCDRLLLFGFIENKLDLSADDVRVVAAELRQEVGQSVGVGSVSVGSDAGGPKCGINESVQPREPDDLAARLLALEEEVVRIRLIVTRERKLLRKAVLLQVDLDAYDDLD
ncbi:XrtA/PEP-CTERM system-associated ATPase [uncultured Lamprocystis sp.]|jgi:putative secretion ATPase (PEP-CTERM system associated)|uniref:XrtA/PEP-CTERM system-associated ATPase n=1 Tax=uncultured Lamprocystis sp. TaxID=543132 RepID=UPI0025D0A2E1|nr:XrtA/PEP-CTERM system-associated ATPase [uncultured Lamprocystis sp.]